MRNVCALWLTPPPPPACPPFFFSLATAGIECKYVLRVKKKTMSPCLFFVISRVAFSIRGWLAGQIASLVFPPWIGRPT